MVRREEIYNLYWYFAAERQNIFYKKMQGLGAPWTEDNILSEFKFCNSYRASDRVSQYLLKNVIYNGKTYHYGDMIFRIILFKLFNKESTWELLSRNFGDIRLDSFNSKEYSRILSEAKEKGEVLYNDAYISCANKAFGYESKHDNHLALLEKMFLIDNMQDKIVSAKDTEHAFEILKEYPLIGNFMAYQLITDINYSEVVDFSEMSFTVAGPGSERGIKKCFISLEGMTYEDIIKWMANNQEQEFERLGIKFKNLGGRPLQYIDCQNVFCELDKYCRQAVPELKSNRTKIKKKYSPSVKRIEYTYPPKWNIELNINCP